MITVGNFDDALVAHMAKGRLLSEGIVAYIADEHFIWANWSISYALGGVKIQVANSDKEKAMHVLSKFSQGHYAQFLPESDSPSICRNCKNTTFKTFNPVIIKLCQLVFYLWSGFVLRVRGKDKRCTSCGLQSKNDDE